MDNSMPDLAHLITFGISTLVFVVLCVAYWGYGHLFFRLSGVSVPRIQSLVVLCGWALSLTFMGVVHLFFPINPAVSFLNVALGLALLAIFREHINYKRLLTLSNLFAFSIFIVFCYWVFSKAMLNPKVVDSTVYHINKIGWVESFPAVPGLGNLHGRLAFNQSFSNFAASLNFLPFVTMGKLEHGWYLGNATVLLLLIMICIEQMFCKSSSKKSSFQTESDGALKILYGIGMVIALYYIVDNKLTSPTPEYAANIMVLILSLLYLEFCYSHSRVNEKTLLSILILIGVAATTIKLNVALFCLMILSAAGIVALGRYEVRIVLRMIMIPAVLFSAWIAAGFITSGCPLFPSGLGCYPGFDWSMSPISIGQEEIFITTFARDSSSPWKEVYEGWQWLPQWWEKMSGSYAIWVPLLCALLLGTVSLIAAIFGMSQKNTSLRNGCFVILIGIGCTAILWFLKAPAARFIIVFLQVLALVAAFNLIVQLRERIESRNYHWQVVVIVLIATSFVPYNYFSRWDTPTYEFSTTGLFVIPTSKFKTVRTRSGLDVFIPEIGGRPYNPPLPATIDSRFDPYLEQRDPDYLGDGFRLAADRPKYRPLHY
ncbi:MAG: hypothetical protein ACI8P9_005167 [Parasphingorhabdus sp.]|jgi:hypothetical protein